MLSSKFLPCTLLALSPLVFAAPPLSAGSQMQQIPPPPIQQSTMPRIEVKPVATEAPAETDRAKIIVNRLLVTGSKAYAEADLLAQTGFAAGAELSLTDLRAMAAKIAAYYHRNGYFVAQAYLPAQEIKDGVVLITVIEGQYGRITLNNQSKVSNGLAHSLLGGIDSGDAVILAPLENRLLLLSDLPGVKVQSTLVPGANPGSSDLIVELTPGARVDGSIDADNAGNRYTGANRIGATVNFKEPLGYGDVASLRALTSGAGLNYVRGAYQMQFGKAKAGVAYSALRYELGQEFESLGAHGSAEVASLYGSYALLRSRPNNLYAGLTLQAEKFRDEVDSASSVTDKSAQVLIASLNGEHRDSSGGGLSTYALALSSGNINLQTPAALAIDAVTAQTNGHFNKLAFSAARLQPVTPTLSLSAAINGQLASKNLDVSEKMELGGMYGVRAYPEGEAFADQGYVLNLEARLLLPKFSESLPGQMQLIGFIDTGSVTLNRNPWMAGPNRRTLRGAGVGLNWSEANNFMVRAYYAFKIGDEAATSAPDASGRFWIQAVKYF